MPCEDRTGASERGVEAYGFRKRSALMAAAGVLASGAAHAEGSMEINGPFGLAVSTFEVVQFALFAGAMSAALFSAVWLIRERGRIAAQNSALRARLADVSAKLQNSEALVRTEGQRAIVWSDTSAKPAVIGTLPPNTGAPDERAAFLAFGRWLTPDSAALLEGSITGLREQARLFATVIETSAGIPLEVTGRTAGGSAVVRFSSLGRERAEHAKLRMDHQRLVSSVETMQSLFDRMQAPVWLRDRSGNLAWVNRAYARAVDSADGPAAVTARQELFGAQARAAMDAARMPDGGLKREMSTVVGGDRKVYEVTEATGSFGVAGIALDVSDSEAVRVELNKTIHSHRETLDQLNTAVAMFDAQGRMQFYNQAFQKLWRLDQAFLESAPDNSMVLDRLRGDGRLQEQPEWRRWKESVLSAYRAVESQEHWWHLPDGQTIRVIANPHPKGGVTWVFENLTEKIDLESRYNTLVHVQGETLDHLAEGVAVFGADGLLRLCNPAFGRFFGLTEGLTKPGAHIARIADASPDAAAGVWSQLVAAVTGFDDARAGESGRMTVNARRLAWAAVPLPNGQTMLTFVDVTDSETIERALTERNEALEKADQLREAFVNHVSYQLRTPLTNIIGFTELLLLAETGPLTSRQTDYVNNIKTSSVTLHETVNDILDLATIDAGIMQLDIAEVSVSEAVQAATDKVRERMAEHHIGLAVRLADPADRILADGTRLRQVLSNLLANAANFAPASSTVVLSGGRTEDGYVFTVHDDGPGIPEDALQEVFGRFRAGMSPGRKRGPGLGLSIVKSFVELHGGSVSIESGKERGTTVTCRFPRVPHVDRRAAE